MRSVSVLFSAVLLIAFADAQRKSNITKPVVNLEKRPRPPVWNRPPEERRKLSIFPRTNMKFVVTPKTEVNNEDAAKQGLPTKRPLMRKFIIQDKNEKRTWSFAPREPLMKTNRFTVTMAPAISSNRNEIHELKSEESKKVTTVISRLNKEQPLSKTHKLNKGNLIEMMQIKNKERPASKYPENVEKTFIEEISPITKVNDTKDFDTIQMNVNSTSKLDKGSNNYPINIRRLNDEDVITSANESENEHDSVKLNPTVRSNTESSIDVIESRAVDLNELKYAIKQHESNSLTMDSEESNNYSIAQVLSFNDLEILLEKNVNNTESSTADFNEKNPPNSPKDISEDIPKFDVTNPNEFYDVVSISNDEGNKTNLEEEKKFFGSVLHGPLMANEKKHTASETNVLNGEDFTEHVADYFIVGNLESRINYMEGTTALENHHQRGIVAESEEIKTNTKLTENPFTKYPTNEIINSFTNDTQYKNKTGFPRELNTNDTDSVHSTEILLEMYESNMSLDSEELPDKLVTEVPNESVTENVHLTIVEIPNEASIESVSVEEISKETIDISNSYIEERSNDSSIDISTGEEIYNESSSNTAGEELSNESGSFIEEIPSEYIIESSNNFTGEEIFNESSSNIAGEEISNESYPDKSMNLTEEGSSEYIIENINNFTGEEISNESSSNMAGEEISNESDESYLTAEISNESTIEIAQSSTGEEGIQTTSIENPDIIIDERISDKSVGSSLEREISEDALINRFKRSNNIIEEENLPTTVSGFKYTGSEITLNHDLSYKNINA